MCTVVILYRPDDTWPVLLAANRDEMIDRPWKPPARHWRDRPHVIGGLDQQAGGSWLALNDHGVVAGILNRPGSLGPSAGKRSRGLLVLDALEHNTAQAAAQAVAATDPKIHRSFNMVVADRNSVLWIRSADGAAKIEAMHVRDGFSILTSHDLNDGSSGRIRVYLPLFTKARLPNPDKAKWSAWRKLMASRESDGDTGGTEAEMLVVSDIGFGTVSSSFIGLPSERHAHATPVWMFAAGPPDRTPYEPVSFDRRSW